MNEDNGPPDDDRTVFMPSGGPPTPPPPPTSPAPAATSLNTSFAPMAPRLDGDRIQVGDVLNHIFEVKRFIARGGMGEVFEGVNITSDERVAIKVMLPALAADPNIQAMFRKEAKTLTRLSHPALVQYRVLAQEPQLGVLYIVTEFVDGANLADVLGRETADLPTLTGMLRCLAEGLRAAHALGAIHRDISPDNVLLEDGRLDRARIIDFGIAKDLDPGSKTIIGDGFAGKLSYVAPEQLGDFDREVGPWSDVYSLALVILAVARGCNVDLGGSFVDAIDKRRKGVDLSDIGEPLRGVLAAMLAANPAERLRSMDAVLDRLGGVAATPPPAQPAATARDAAPKPAPATSSSALKYYIGGGVAAAALLGTVGYIAFGGSGSTTPPATSTAVAPSVSAAAKARAAVTAVLPNVTCSWLDVTQALTTADGVTLALAGVAGQPIQAEAAVSQAVQKTGASVASVDFAEVAPIAAEACSSLDAFRAIRSPDATTHLAVPQRHFEMSRLADGDYAGKIAARTVLNLTLGADVKDFALYGLDPKGTISPLIENAAVFKAMEKPGFPVADLGGGKYRIQADADAAGWSGILLLTGNGGFSDDLVATGAGTRSPEWRKRFADAAARGGWRAEMVWFKMVDELPN